ncbi:hypothetical protein FVE85_6904 [Porphyridium purpureum]|uniref:Uncharacterized protein n=1 Tax=Porphyridium purpureum TaxID=35688 RepID=A0A5J4Z5I8_PORPP|nr:hypothetical protein FVE85_6904 [Porphyridium purpureum]|eukprot:POR7912..scf295_1
MVWPHAVWRPTARSALVCLVMVLACLAAAGCGRADESALDGLRAEHDHVDAGTLRVDGLDGFQEENDIEGNGDYANLAGVYDPKNWAHLRIVRPDKSQVPLIQCGVCQAMANQIAALAKTMIQEEDARASPKSSSKAGKGKRNRLPLEIRLLDMLEHGFCDPHSVYGASWIPHLEVVHNTEQNTLEFATHKEEGRCGVECRTIAFTCEQILADKTTEVGALLYKKRHAIDQTDVYVALDCPAIKCRKPSSERVTTTFEVFEPLNEFEREAANAFRAYKYEGDVPAWIYQMINGQGVRFEESAPGEDPDEL